MTKSKIRIAIIFGGKSAEHEVSLQSARNVIRALNLQKYEPLLVGIDKDGRWYRHDSADYLLNETNPKLIALNKRGAPVVAMIPTGQNGGLANLDNPGTPPAVDVAFPIMHGTYGEDGAIQGLLKMMDVPFVGPSVLGSAVCMDKDMAKRLLRDAGVPVAAYTVICVHEKPLRFADVKRKLGLPLFIKPANLGSSVGISRVRGEKEYKVALAEAFRYDNKVLVEEAISGREVEVAVLGNEKPEASLPGEIIPNDDFYTYKAKYVDENGATLIIPARLSKKTVKELQNMAVTAFRALNCEGMARVDFFLRADGKIVINELNTIPGFTNISMYPKLWEVSGLPYNKLIDRLVELAIDRYRRDKKLKTKFL